MKRSIIAKLAGVLLVCSSLSACGTHSDLKYQYKESMNNVSCDTGPQEFSSEEDYCAGLQNKALNKDCGLEHRKQLFQQKCSGSFKEA